MTQPPKNVEAKDPAGLRRTIFFSVLAGLCPLIPIPFIDDLALGLVRKQLTVSLFSAFELQPSPAQLAAFLQDEKPNVLVGCLASFVLYPIKKLFKKIFFVLALKDCVDAAAAALHEGILLRHALSSGQLDAARLASDPACTATLAAAIRTTCKQTDTRPVNQALRRVFTASRADLAAAAATLGAVIRSKGGDRKNPDSVERAFETVEQQSNPQVDRLVDEIGTQMFAEPGYLDALKKRFDANYRQATGGVTPPAAPPSA